MTATEPVAISIPEAARRLGVSGRHLYSQARTGRFWPAYRIGRRWVVSTEALERYQREQTQGGAA